MACCSEKSAARTQAEKDCLGTTLQKGEDAQDTNLDAITVVAFNPACYPLTPPVHTLPRLGVPELRYEPTRLSIALCVTGIRYSRKVKPLMPPHHVHLAHSNRVKPLWHSGKYKAHHPRLFTPLTFSYIQLQRT